MVNKVAFVACIAILAASGCSNSPGGRGGARDGGGIRLDGGPGDDVGPVPDGGPRVDGGPRTDTGPQSCSVGESCTGARGCRGDDPSFGEFECIEEFASAVGEAKLDEIVGAPGGATTIPTTIWEGGYCVPQRPSATDLSGCDSDDDCPDCSECVNLGGGQSMCLRSCVPEADGNGGCADGQACDLGARVCFPGCGSDDECRVYRADTNADGTTTAPEDGETAVDRLTYDADSDATCNLTTRRCVHSAAEGKRSGDTCTKDSECPADQNCFAPSDTFPGGLCTQFSCSDPGFECPNEADSCITRLIGSGGACLSPCTVGGEAEDLAARIGPLGHGDGCREGYACFWNGTDGAIPNNGGCWPGNYNEQPESTLGGACTEDTDCWSPFGIGQCFTGKDQDGFWGAEGMCTVVDCGASGLPSDTDPNSVCGEGGTCVANIFSDQADLGLCLDKCETGNDCGAGLGCVMVGEDKVCFPSCGAQEDCRDAEFCVIAEGDMFGECVTECDAEADCPGTPTCEIADGETVGGCVDR